jgi:hypothetical protein
VTRDTVETLHHGHNHNAADGCRRGCPSWSGQQHHQGACATGCIRLDTHDGAKAGECITGDDPRPSRRSWLRKSR